MPFKKLQVVDGISTEELIAQIERKDRIFRMAQTLFMVATFVALVVVIGFQNRTLNGVQEQIEDAKNTALAQSKQRDESDNKIIRRLDCMVVFFSQRDRNNLTIQNIEECTLDRDGDIQRFFTSDPNGGQTTTTPTEQEEGAQTPKAQAPR